MAREIAREHGGNVLFLAPWRVLIPQTHARFTEGDDAPFKAEDVGVLMSPRKPRLDRPVQVGSVETVRQWLPKLDALSPKLVIIDEAHRSATELRRGLLDTFSDADHLLLSATPFRRGGGGLREIADELVEVAGVRELIDEGYLSPYVHYTGDPKIADGVPIVDHDYEEDELARRLRNPKVVGCVVDDWLAQARDRPTLAFATNRDHSNELVRGFLAAGVTAEHLDNETPQGERLAMLERLRSGETRVIANCNVLTEGFDEPCVSCVILRPTRNLGVYIQQAGRGLRLLEGKPDCVILDPGGNALRLGMVDQPRTYTLDGVSAPEADEDVEEDEAPEAAPTLLDERDPPVPCVSCKALSPASVRKCPQCGWFDVRPSRLPAAVEGSLEEVTAEELEGDPIANLRRILNAGTATGYGVYWAAAEYALVHGTAPDSGAIRRRVERELNQQAETEGRDRAWVQSRLRDLYG